MKRRISLSPLPASAGEERRAVHDDRDPRPALSRVLLVREHVQQEEELPVADPRQAGPEPAGGAPVVLAAHRVLVALPVLAVGGIGDQVVEVVTRVPVARERAPGEDVLGVAAVLRLHEEVRLADREGLGVHLLAEEVNVGVGVHGLGKDFAVPRFAGDDVLLGDREHAARAAARVVDAPHDALRAQAVLVPGQQQVHHQMDDVTGGEVLARVLVQRLVELPDEFLEDCAHRRVVHLVRVETHLRIAEPLDHQEQEPGLVELRDGVVEVEVLQHLAHVATEPGDVVAEVPGNAGGVGQELVEVVAGRVVERESGGLPEQGVEIVDLAAEPGLDLQHPRLGGGQHRVEPAQHGQRQDHVLVLAAFEGVADQVRHAPEEADDLAVVHGRRRI